MGACFFSCWLPLLHLLPRHSFIEFLSFISNGGCWIKFPQVNLEYRFHAVLIHVVLQFRTICAVMRCSRVSLSLSLSLSVVVCSTDLGKCFINEWHPMHPKTENVGTIKSFSSQKQKKQRESVNATLRNEL